MHDLKNFLEDLLAIVIYVAVIAGIWFLGCIAFQTLTAGDVTWHLNHFKFCGSAVVLAAAGLYVVGVMRD